MEQISIKREETQDNRCRVCLQPTDSTICLLHNTSIEEAAVSYWDILQLITKIELQRENGVNTPQRICPACAERAESSYDFKVLCENSDKILQRELNFNTLDVNEILNNLKTEVTEEKLLDYISPDGNQIDVPEILKVSAYKSKADEEDEFDNNKVDILEPNIFDNENSDSVNLSDSINEKDFQLNEDSSNITDDAELESTSIKDNSVATTIPSVNNRTCKTCGRVFVLKRNLAAHVQAKKCGRETFPANCRNCDYEPTSLVDYNNHRRDIHNFKIENRKCPFCDFGYTSLKDYKEHLLESHIDKKKGCRLCEKVYFAASSLKKHMQDEHPGDMNFPEKCEMCSFTPNSLKSFKKHMKETHEIVVDKKTCKFCDYSSTSSFQLGRHVASRHDDKKIIQCTLCEKKFFNRNNLRQHLKKLHRKISLMCEVCGKIVMGAQALKEHLFLHNGIKNYECKVCGAKFGLSRYLKIHSLNHSEGRYACEQCGATFKRDIDLASHVTIVHEKVKRHECTLCVRKFYRSDSLRRHMNSHIGLHKCVVCERLFGTKLQLETHQYIHTGEKRHACEICGKKLASAKTMKKHLRMHAKMIKVKNC